MLRVRPVRVVDVQRLEEQPSATVAGAAKRQHVCLDDAQQGTIPASLGVLQCEEGSLLASRDAPHFLQDDILSGADVLSGTWHLEDWGLQQYACALRDLGGGDKASTLPGMGLVAYSLSPPAGTSAVLSVPSPPWCSRSCICVSSHSCSRSSDCCLCSPILLHAA